MSCKPPRDLGPVVQAPLDLKTYKAVELENGLSAVLVSTCEHEDRPNRSTPRDTVTSFNKRVLGINSYSVIDDGNSPSEDDDGWANGKLFESNGRESPEEPSDLPEDSTDASPPKKRKRCGVDRATICVCVGAGSFHDPPGIYGMAHLTEHVIFLGSKRFPHPNLLFHKVFENGGVVNAVTFAEHTRFYFSCNCSSFEDCVEMLADALHQPLLDSTSVLREVEAVDSEYGIKQTCDGTRMYDFLRSLANVHHPLRKFYWGNKESLSHPQLVERLRSWQGRYYRGSNMTVCMQGPLPLQQLEEILVRHFSSLSSADPQCPSPTKELILQGPPFEPSRFCAMYHIAPVAHMSQLLITWAMPASAWKNYEGKPLQYIRWMLTSTHPGGLRRFLIEKGWIRNFFASCSKSDNIFRNSFCALFCVEIELTDKGVLEKDLVIEALFSYLKLLHSEGVQQNYFEEMKRTSANAFHFCDWTELIETGIDIAANLRWASPKDVLTCNRLMSKFEKEKIQVCLDRMCPRAANFILVAKDGVQSCTTEACWGCPICHTKIVIEEEFYAKLDNIPVYSSFRLPGKGDFLAKEISLEKQQYVPPGKLVLETEKLLVRHIQPTYDDMRLSSQILAKGRFSVYLYSPVIGQRPYKQCLLMVWLRIVIRDLFLLTGIKFWKLFEVDLEVHDECLCVWVKGPSCHLGELLETILTLLVKSEPSCEVKSTFDNMKVELEREYINGILGVRTLAEDLHSFLLLSEHRSLFELKAILEESDFEDFTCLLHNFRRTLSCEVEMEGFVVKSDCERITGFLSSLDCTAAYNGSPFPIFPPRATLLPPSQSVLHVQGLHPSYVVSVLTNHYQFGEISAEKLHFAEILCRLMRRRIAGQLRTKEQLGYTVQMFLFRDCGSVGLTVVVFTQPQKFATAYVDSRVETFFRTFHKAFFQDETLARKMLVRVTQTDVDLKGLRCFYENYLLPKGSCLRKLSIQVTGFRPPTENPCRKGGPTGKQASDDGGKCTFLEYLIPNKEGQYKNATPISNITQFKRGLALLPPEPE